jgi:hypothetical protein
VHTSSRNHGLSKVPFVLQSQIIAPDDVPELSSATLRWINCCQPTVHEYRLVVHSVHSMSAAYIRPNNPSIVHCTTYVHFEFFFTSCFCAWVVVAWSTERITIPRCPCGLIQTLLLLCFVMSGRPGSDLVTLIGYYNLSCYWLSSEKNEMGEAYGTYGKQERCNIGFWRGDMR